MAKRAKSKNTIPYVSDNDVIDLVTKFLFYDTSKEYDLEKDILKVSKLKYTPSDLHRIWKLLLETNMVEQSIGFGKAGKIELSSNGLLIMNKYGSYLDYINHQTQGPGEITVLEVTPESEKQKKTVTKLQAAKPKKRT